MIGYNFCEKYAFVYSELVVVVSGKHDKEMCSELSNAIHSSLSLKL